MNQPTQIELLFDNPVTGTNQYGEYYLYAVRNGDGSTEYSLFAPPEVHQVLKEHRKGDVLTITKLAEKDGSKVITKFDIKKVSSPDTPVIDSDRYFTAMLSSYQDAMKIQSEMNGLADVNRIAITLFIARSRVGNFNYGG